MLQVSVGLILLHLLRLNIIRSPYIISDQYDMPSKGVHTAIEARNISPEMLLQIVSGNTYEHKGRVCFNARRCFHAR